METTDSAAMFKFKDPFEDVPYTDPSFFFPENASVQDTLHWPDFQQPGYELSNIVDLEDPLSDPVIWSFCNGTDIDDPTDIPGPGPFHFAGEGSSHDNVELFNCLDNSVPGDQSAQTPYNCVCCKRLRVISHTNDISVKRLEIHGRLGLIDHAVLEIYSFDSSLKNHEILRFDFHNWSLEAVKNYLIQYFEACKQEGHRKLQDPLLSFYQTLSVGSNDPDNLNDFLHFSPNNTVSDCPNNQHQTLRTMEDRSNQGDPNKIPLAMQRERTRNLKLKDLREYFNLPIEDAAHKLNICPTVMKKICRRNGMLRWPYRKIKSLERKISSNVQMLDSSHGEERAQLLENIQKHQRELANIYEAFTE